MKRILIFLLALAFCQASAQIDSGKSTKNSGHWFTTKLVDSLWILPKTPSLILGWKDSSITFQSAEGKKAKLFLGDSLRVEGEVSPTESAKILFWAIETVWRESYNKQWERLAYLQEKLEKYRSQLTPQYSKAFELWLEQEQKAGRLKWEY